MIKEGFQGNPQLGPYDVERCNSKVVFFFILVPELGANIFDILLTKSKPKAFEFADQINEVKYFVDSFAAELVCR